MKKSIEECMVRHPDEADLASNLTKRSQKSVIVAGPTAIGKTACAIEIARRFGGEIISADSMQVYKGMDIGTAKPSAGELAQVPHHLIGVIDPKTPDYSAAVWRAFAGVAIDDVRARGLVPVIAGGTGLYIHSLIYDLDFSGTGGDAELRAHYETLAENFGNSYIYDILLSKAPEAAKIIHPNNRKRIIRALERIGQGGEKTGLKSFDGAWKPGAFYNALLIFLNRDRSELYGHINVRVDKLLESGLVDEVLGLKASGVTERHIAMLGIGYKEVLAYVNGEFDAAEMAERIRRNTRRYAKRQITWFKRYERLPGFRAFNFSGYPSKGAALDEIMRIVDDYMHTGIGLE